MLGDRYRIDELLSVGGMGAVYSGTHTLLQKRVAIKVLRSELPGADSMLDRFRREAIAASSIGHENIVQVTDMGVIPDGTAYLIMELLIGRSLGDAIESEGAFTLERSCRIAGEILGGLGAAHRSGIVHRDLKPDNIFLARSGEREVIKLLDFGVSLLKRPDVPDSRLTSTGTLVGTPRYMSPEQARGSHDLTGAADIYAAGVVLYEMLTGELPYFGDNYNVVIHEIIAGEWAPIETRAPGIPEAIAAVVHQALAVAPEDRFATAEEMAAALAGAAGDDKSAATSGGARAVAEAASSWRTSTIGRGRETTPSRPSRIAAALASTAVADMSDPDSPAGSGPKPGGRRLVAADDEDPKWAGSGAKTRSPSGMARLGGFADERDDRGGSKHGGGFTLVLLGAIILAAGLFLILRGGGDGAEPPSPAPDDGATQVAAAAPAAEPAPEIAEPARPEPEPAAEPAPAAEPVTKEARSPRSRPSRPASRQPEPAPVKPAPKPEKVTIQFLIVPASATIVVDGRSLGGKRLELERSKKPLSVRIEAPGYESRTLKVVPDKDNEVIFQLIRKPEEREPAPEPPPEPAPAPEPESPVEPDAPAPQEPS
jgi:serine/threonine-protein kinase